MAKKLSASFRPARLKSMSGEDIRNRQLTNRESQAVRRIAARQAAGDDSRINLKVTPRLTDRQLAAMVRLRDIRPRKKAVSVRLDEACAGLVEIEGPGSFDADQRHSREYDGGGAEGRPQPLGDSPRESLGRVRAALSRSTPRSSECADSGHANFIRCRIREESRRGKQLCRPEGLSRRARSRPRLPR